MESQSVNKKRIYREWQEGDTGYYKGIKGKISIDKDTPTSFKIDWHSELREDRTNYACFTIDGKFLREDEDPSLSFLPNEQSMPFDYRHTIIPYSESTVKELRKNTITHKINKIETKLSKLNDKREKLLERYKSLGQ